MCTGNWTLHRHLSTEAAATGFWQTGKLSWVCSPWLPPASNYFPSARAFCTTSHPPPLLSLFFLVGLFTFASGQCTGDQQHVQYKTTIACLQQLPIPADISIECASSDLILQDGTTMFLISRTFVPSCSDTRPILTDTLQIAPIPGNPTDKQSYQHHMPTFCILFVITQGTVASADTTGPSATLSFPLAMSNYIQSSVKSSTLAFVSSFISVFLLTWPIFESHCT